MTKMLLLLSLICLGVLAVGTALFAQNPAFWLASGASADQYIRAALMLVLVLQLSAKPPRHVVLRLLSGALAAGVGVWAVEMTYANQMLFLDAMSFMSAAIAIGVTALERKPQQIADSIPGSIKQAMTA